MRDVVMMECGHAANGTRGNGDPVCVICFGIRPGSDTIAQPPDLSEREAQCNCGYITGSSMNLAFFEHRPNSQLDHYYCGCHGWD